MVSTVDSIHTSQFLLRGVTCKQALQGTLPPVSPRRQSAPESLLVG